MKINLITILVFLLISSCSSSQEEVIEKNQEKDIFQSIEIENSFLPIRIEFGAIGKGANLPPTIFEIIGDTILITSKDRNNFTNVKNYSINSKETKFGELFSNLSKEDFAGNKHYYNPLITDGGYMKISTKYGERKFSNTFTTISNKSFTKPDTIGLSKFESISKYANSLIREIVK